MADVKISELPVGTTLTGTEEIPMAQSGATVKMTAQDIADLASPTAGVSSVVAGSGISVDNTDPANPIISATGGGGGIPDAPSDGTTYGRKDGAWEAVPSGGGAGDVSEIPDPARTWFGPTGVIIATASGIAGDPFIVHDGVQWIMFHFEFAGGNMATVYRTAPSLEGPWSAATTIPSLNGFHKFVLLVDENREPVQVGGVYHAYAVFFSGTNSSKVIHHFTSASLTGAWSSSGVVIPKNLQGPLDAFNTDTPYAILKDGVIHLWYMGAPSASQGGYGLAVRMLRATATSPSGPFTYADEVIPPAAAAGWDYGWMGGVQIMRRPSGGYMMVYNAGSVRPSGAGHEPAPSAAGYAYSDSLTGPWTRDSANPYFAPVAAAAGVVEANNVWRVHLAYDESRAEWFAFYNANTGPEVITFARRGFTDFMRGTGVDYSLLTINTNVRQVPGSEVHLPAGTYRVHAQMNLIADTSGSSPKLDVDTALRVNGVAYRTNRDFVGNFAYENFDTVLHYIVRMPVAGKIDLSVQVTNGAPTSGSKARRLRMNVQRL